MLNFRRLLTLFRWYKNAAKCYVYLSDVSVGQSVSSDLSQQIRKRDFQRSRWFTRGWTLQDLLAPTSVELFSVGGERLGDRFSLMQEIHDITGIPIQALQGRPLSQFSVNERLSWAARRETKHEEDAVYSLLGIFDIHMPFIYGEGRQRALNRLLKEVKDYESVNLPITKGASFDSFFATSIFERATFIFLLVLFVLLSGIALGICVLQTREPACNPIQDKLSKEDGFWALLSQLFLQVVSVYCTLYPVANHKHRIRVPQLWFAALLVVSFTACILAPALYVTSWEAAAVLSFVSNLTAVTFLAQLAAGFDVKNDRDLEKTRNM